MMRWSGITSTVFLTLGFLVQSSSADWVDDMCKKPGACWEVGPLSPGMAKLLELNSELSGILSKFRDTAKKYQGVAREEVNVLNAQRRCKEFVRMNPGRDLEEVSQNAERVITILQIAQLIVRAGETPPDGIKEAIDGDLPGVMRRVIAVIGKLQSNCNILP